MHANSELPILYFGTPVVLISTLNEDGSCNLAPMSSVFWLGWRCMLGLAAFSKTTQNMIRTGECVLNLPSENEVTAVDRLALTTGSNPMPEFKSAMGYRHEADKFGTAGLTPVPSETVAPPRVGECPVQLEAVVTATHRVGDDNPAQRGFIVCLETRIQRVHVEESILMQGQSHRIDPDKWRPLLMSFQQFYGLGARLQPSRLAAMRLEGLAPDSARHRRQLFPGRRGHRPPGFRQGRGTGGRCKSGRALDSLPSRHPAKRQARRVSLGRDQEAGDSCVGGGAI